MTNSREALVRRRYRCWSSTAKDIRCCW